MWEGVEYSNYICLVGNLRKDEKGFEGQSGRTLSSRKFSLHTDMCVYNPCDRKASVAIWWLWEALPCFCQGLSFAGL